MAGVIAYAALSAVGGGRSWALSLVESRSRIESVEGQAAPADFAAARDLSAVRTPQAAPERRKISFPLDGTYRLDDLLRAYGLSAHDVLPHGGATLGSMFSRFDVDPLTAAMTIDLKESVDQRVKRWGFNANSPLSVEGLAQFRALFLATLESYFRSHSRAVPEPSQKPLDPEDQFSGALLREALGHDLYANSLTKPGSLALSDGSVLFETAFAYFETGNFDFLADKAILLSQLEMLRLDAQDGVMNGVEQRTLAVELFDSVAGTTYAARMKGCAPAPKAVVSRDALRGPFLFPVDFASVQAIASDNHVPVETFIRALVVFHALAVSGIKSAREPGALDRVVVLEAQGARANPKRFTFGFISSLFDEAVKKRIQADLGGEEGAGQPSFLRGDSHFPGIIGKGGFLERVLFDNFGAECP